MSWAACWKVITATKTEPAACGVQARQLSASYGDVNVLSDIDLAAEPGAITVILGPNAAGKTTLLRVLASLARPTGGELWVAGLDPRNHPAAVRAAVGLVAHRPLLHPDLSAVENLRYYARLYDLADEDAALETALRTVGMWERRHDRVRVLSRGLQQRSAIARAILHRPPVLLLDEPYTGLDPFSADTLDVTLRALAEDGQTVLVTSHDLRRAQGLADWLLLLAQGRVLWQGPPRAVGPEGLVPLYRRLTGEAIAAAAADVAPAAGAALGPLGSASRPAVERVPAGEDRAISPPKVDLPSAAPGIGAAIRAILWKDLVVEWRAREIVPPVLVFALVTLVVFHFTMATEPRLEPLVAPGALWVALVFGSMLGLARLVGGEVDTGCLVGLVASPADRGGLFLGKWLAGYVFSLAVAAVLLPAFTVLLNLRPGALPGLAAVVVLGLVGWQAAGTLMSTLAVTARAREVLLPVLLFPVTLPLLVAAVQASSAVLADLPLADAAPAWAMMGGYGIIFLVAGFLLYPLILETVA